MCLWAFCRAPLGVLSCASRHFIVCPEAREQLKFVCKLEKCMMELVQIMHDIVERTNRYENHRSGKDN